MHRQAAAMTMAAAAWVVWTSDPAPLRLTVVPEGQAARPALRISGVPIAAPLRPAGPDSRRRTPKTTRCGHDPAGPRSRRWRDLARESDRRRAGATAPGTERARRRPIRAERGGCATTAYPAALSKRAGELPIHGVRAAPPRGRSRTASGRAGPASAGRRTARRWVPARSSPARPHGTAPAGSTASSSPPRSASP